MTIKSRHIFLSAALFAGMSFFSSCDNQFIEQEPADQIVKASAENGTIISGEYIITFRNTPTEKGLSYKKAKENVFTQATKMLANYAISPEVITQTYGSAIRGFAANLNDNQITALKANPDIIIEPNRVVTLGRPSGGGGGSAAQETPWGITRVGGATANVSGRAWVLDTGIDLDHEDLNVDVVNSRSFIASGKDARDADDGNGHGTHCAGTIAAIDNNVGVIGVAPGALVVAVKVLDSRGSGDYAGVIAGVDYVASAASRGDVASMSLGGPVSPALDAAIEAAASKGIYFALAAGNESQDANNVSPAHVNGSTIYTVSAIDVNDRFASFSNYGNPPVDVAAPGVSIKSTWKGGGYNTISGTSMATPHVAGLLLATGGNLRTNGSALNDPDGNADPIAHK